MIEPTDSDASPPPSLPSVTNPLLLRRLDELLVSLRSENLSESDNRVSKLVEFLDSTSASVVDEGPDDNNAFEILSRVNQTLSEDQNLVDAISNELPKSVARFAPVSNRLLDMAETIIIFLARNSNPRDMLSMFCEALSSPGDMYKEPNYFAPLLGGIAQVFVLIRRRQFEQIKATVPIILRILKVMSLELSDEDMDLEVLFHKAICIADSIKTVCSKLEGKDNNELRAWFGLYLLQLVALSTMGMRHNILQCLPLVLQLSHFLPYSGLSYIGLITGSDVYKLLDISEGGDGDNFVSSFSHIQYGASLSVIWGYKSADIATSAEANMDAIVNELRNNFGKRWQAVDMMKHILLNVYIPWGLKHQAVDFLVNIMTTNKPLESLDEMEEFSIPITSLYSSLQGLQVVIMSAPDATLRKKAYAAFKQALANIQAPMKFYILNELVKNSDSSSMIAVLLNIVKEEMHSEITKRTSKVDNVLEAANGAYDVSCFWSGDVLQFVEMVLKPLNGGPPSLPEFSDAVLSALNLYRYILLTESNGKTNYTGVLSKVQLTKAYREWLLPLRTIVAGIEAENQKNCDQLASVICCALNPVELVMYRCIELIEDSLATCLDKS